jgi:hypothetical protein
MMLIEEISADVYKTYLPDWTFIYTSIGFNELNKYKVDEVKYLLFRDSKPRFIICIGVRDSGILCPFSAPFGMLLPIKKHTSLSQFNDAVKSFDLYISENQIKNVIITLPPMFYRESDISMIINSLIMHEFHIKYIDLNYQIDLRNVVINDYINHIESNARKNLNISIQTGLKFMKCSTEEEKTTAYHVIRRNRESKGYPLRMTEDQVLQTARAVKNDFFIVLNNQEAIAAAIVFYVNQEIVQVIYWGDIPGHSQVKPINFLSFQLIVYYKQQDLHYLDIGPSTENGIPNYGLCDFKHSFGCDISNKFTFEKQYL